MANIIAVIWDCDKTLIDGNMQDPIFAHYNVDGPAFWRATDEEIRRNRETGIRINEDTYYLNTFIHGAHNGTFPGLGNAQLRAFGAEQRFYPGIPELFRKTKALIENDKSFAEYGIQVEHYIVSTGFAEVIRGSALAGEVDGIWGCELLEDGQGLINEIVYTIDNTTKTRAIFEINKGNGVPVNSKIPEDLRRVKFENMIYIADGPSDIPAFSVIKKGGGATFAIYPKGDLRALNQVEQMRMDGRVDMYAEADYTEGTTAYLWIAGKILKTAERIREAEKEKIAFSCAPKHLN